MPINLLFPLAIYYADIENVSGQQKQRLTQYLLSLKDTYSDKNTDPFSSWTGDVNGVDQLHNDDSCAWLIKHIAHHARCYLQELGYELTDKNLYIQRCWPVFAEYGAAISRHCHHNAHLSGVYYLQGEEENGGDLTFFNAAKQNDVLIGELNFDDKAGLLSDVTSYPPLSDRLYIFPAKQEHGVTVNKSRRQRISISFDMLITSAESEKHRSYSSEYRMRSPDTWRQV